MASRAGSAQFALVIIQAYMVVGDHLLISNNDNRIRQRHNDASDLDTTGWSIKSKPPNFTAS